MSGSSFRKTLSRFPLLPLFLTFYPQTVLKKYLFCCFGFNEDVVVAAVAQGEKRT